MAASMQMEVFKEAQFIILLAKQNAKVAIILLSVEVILIWFTTEVKAMGVFVAT